MKTASVRLSVTQYQRLNRLSDFPIFLNDTDIKIILNLLVNF